MSWQCFGNLAEAGKGLTPEGVSYKDLGKMSARRHLKFNLKVFRTTYVLQVIALTGKHNKVPCSNLGFARSDLLRTKEK